MGIVDCYELAGDVLSRAAARESSLRSLLFSMKDRPHWKQTYALATETRRFGSIVDAAIERCEVLREVMRNIHEDRLKWMVRVLCYDVAIGGGKGLRRRPGKLCRIVFKNRRVSRTGNDDRVNVNIDDHLHLTIPTNNKNRSPRRS